MRLFITVFLGIYFCSFENRFANGDCQDKDRTCSQNKIYCPTHDHVRENCPLTCQLCTPGFPSLAAFSTLSHLPSSSSLSPSPLSTSMTSVHQLSPLPSTTIVLKSSVVGNVDNKHNKTREVNPTDESSTSMMSVHMNSRVVGDVANNPSPTTKSSTSMTSVHMNSSVDNNPNPTTKSPTTKSSAQRVNISLKTISMLTGYLWSYYLR